MSHYFTNGSALTDNEQSFCYAHGGYAFTFTANTGMFSPGHIDPATDLLIKAMPKLTGSLLDLGCGYGPVGIVLGKVNGLAVTMSDVNARALTYAERNCAGNGFGADIIESDCFDNIGASFDTIVLNPPIHAGKDVVYRMYEEAYRHLLPRGKLYIVIQEKHGARSAIQKLREIFGSCETAYKKKGYYILVCALTPSSRA